MKVLLGCECSGVFLNAFLAEGYDAWSIDLQPSEIGSNRHITGDIFDYLDEGWDLLAVLHPPCTILCNSGAKHLYIGGRKENGRNEQRWIELEKAAAFYRKLKAAPIRCKAIENPVMHSHAIKMTERGFTQFVHPYFFGEPFFKNTGFELINLPKLIPTNKLTPPRPGTAKHKAWSRVHRMAPGPNRAKDRSRSYQGMALAAASQWGKAAELMMART